MKFSANVDADGLRDLLNNMTWDELHRFGTAFTYDGRLRLAMACNWNFEQMKRLHEPPLRRGSLDGDYSPPVVGGIGGRDCLGVEEWVEPLVKLDFLRINLNSITPAKREAAQRVLAEELAARRTRRKN